MNPNHSPRKRKTGANPKSQAMRDFALRFYEAHRNDLELGFTSKERMALHLHDVELPRHFAGQKLPSWSRIRVWLPKDGYLVPRMFSRAVAGPHRKASTPIPRRTAGSGQE